MNTPITDAATWVTPGGDKVVYVETAKRLERQLDKATWKADQWHRLAVDLAALYKTECECDMDNACRLCVTLGEISHADSESPL